MEPTAVGEVLGSVDGTDCEDFYKRYLHDFVRLAHRCTHLNQEHEKQEYEVNLSQYDWALAIMQQRHF